MILVALALCSLLSLDTLSTVIFTIIFTVCTDSAFIYLKLRYTTDAEERAFIEKHLRRAKRLVLGICRFVQRSEGTAQKKVKM